MSFVEFMTECILSGLIVAAGFALFAFGVACVALPLALAVAWIRDRFS